MERFRHLAQTWRKERVPTSSITRLAMHPAYQQIIGMGEDALPLILQELREKPDHWFWALAAISGEDPVPAASKGKLQEMADAWLQWGRSRGYLK